jgi:hypothetical protein
MGSLDRVGAWPSWVSAWTGGAPAVHVGNVAEFNAAFGGIRAGRDHYSCLTAFASPRPTLIVPPLPVQEWWIRHLALLGWGEVRVRGGIAADGQVSAALAGLPELVPPEVAVLPWAAHPHSTGSGPLSPGCWTASAASSPSAAPTNSFASCLQAIAGSGSRHSAG